MPHNCIYLKKRFDKNTIKKLWSFLKSSIMILTLAIFLFSETSACMANEKIVKKTNPVVKTSKTEVPPNLYTMSNTYMTPRPMETVNGTPYRQVYDHAVPDLCSKSRKLAYRFGVSLVSMISVGGALCIAGGIIAYLAGPVGWVIGGITCAVGAVFLVAAVAMAVSFGYYMATYEACCNNMKDKTDYGISKEMLQNAALCSMCKSKDNVLRGSCNT